MISYTPFWDTIKHKKKTTYTLIKCYHVNPRTINKLRNNMPLNTASIDELCRILNCKVEDIMVYKEDKGPYYHYYIDEMKRNKFITKD